MSDMKQNRRNGLRAESASLSGPCTCSSTLIRTTSQGQRGMRDGMSGKEREGGGGCPFNIWALMHSSVMKHNLLIPLGTDENHFKQPGTEREDICRGEECQGKY